MSALGDRIRSQAAISDRPGQMAELERIADEVDALAAKAWDEGYGDDLTCNVPRENPYRSR